jgi:PPOX class probable F420-dependent enzyme
MRKRPPNWLKENKAICFRANELWTNKALDQKSLNQQTRPGRDRQRFPLRCTVAYNIPMPVPAEIQGQRYISLATFRKTGVPIYTPIWFAEDQGRLYFMTSSKLGKVKRIRNNGQIKIAPCTIRGKITGPESPATARILPPQDFERVRTLIKAKYWLARLPLLWRNTDTGIEITPGS